MNIRLFLLFLLLLHLIGCNSKWDALDLDGDGFTLLSGDCDEGSPAIHPDAIEIWYDGIDDNCDANDGDQDFDGFVPQSYADNFPDWAELAGHLAVGDCWDDPAVAYDADYTDANGALERPAADVVNPDATDVWYDGVDQDCSGNDDFDQDGDSFPSANHTRADGNPAGADCVDGSLQDWTFTNEDGDEVSIESAGFTALEINPVAVDICYDAIDADCNGGSDFDCDGDSYNRRQECDDGDGAINPEATEVCDEVDNNCDGAVDEGVTNTYYQDTDADGFGDPDFSISSCEEPTGYSEQAGDCDDSEAEVNPEATEVCDDIDNDCDGSVDVDATDAGTWYADSDSDGFGGDSTVTACDQPSGMVADTTDCVDNDPTINPDATEVCDEIDNDCDGSVDVDATDAGTWYADSDSDGFGGDASVTACDQPSGMVADTTDCDDTNVEINPSEVDFNYNGVEEACSPEQELVWWVDRYNGTLSECDFNAGTTCTAIVSGLGEMVGVAYDGDQTVYVSQLVGTITEIDLLTLTTTTFTTGFSTPVGLSWDFYNQQLLVVELTMGKLWGFDPGADARVELAAGFSEPVDAISTSAVTFQVTDRGEDEVVEVDTSAGTQTQVWAISEPNCIVNGYATSREDGTVENGAGTAVFTGLGSGNGKSLTLSPDGTGLVVGDALNGQAYWFTPTSTPQTPGSSGVVTFTGLSEPFEGVSNNAP